MNIQFQSSRIGLQFNRNSYFHQDKGQALKNHTAYFEMANNFPAKSLNELQGKYQVNFAGLNPKIILQKNKGIYTIIDSIHNTEVAYASTIMDGNSVYLFQINSKVKNQGYGTKLINQIKKDYIETGKVESIKLNASWEEFPKGFPPHKFYIKNGFVPDNEKQAAILEDWINKGANAEDFPLSCFECNMTYTK